MFSATEQQFMARAVQLAEHGKYWARPNPHVGCVLVREEESRIVGEGFTQAVGGDHAEVGALRAAGSEARGATAFVTLEPCSHYGRTPPCTAALIEAGVARVVAAISDPDPRVAGQGLSALEQAGVRVEQGLLASQVEAQLAGFLLRQRRGRGLVRAKLAMSLDGRTAMASGESQWITGPPARADVQRLRAQSCAILTGVGTVLADDCALTVRDAYFSAANLPPPSRRALRVVADSQLRTPPGAAVLAGEQPTLLVHASAASVPDALHDVPRVAVPVVESQLDLVALLQVLNDRACNDILVESGSQLAGALLRQGLLDELVIYIAPRLLGSRAKPLFELPLDSMADACDLSLTDERRVGHDLRLTYKPASAR